MILRTELRRSAAPVVGAGFVVLALALLYGLSGPWHKGSAPWNGQWIGLAQWSRNLMMFLWPLVLGAGAWQGLRDRRSHMTELLGTMPRPPARRVAPVLGALSLGLIGGYLVLLAFGATQVVAHTSYFTLTWLPVAGVLVLALVATAVLGVAVGRLVPSLLTPPVAAIVALAAQVVAGRAGWPVYLTPAFDGLDISVFTAVAPKVSAVQALWFAGLGMTGYFLVVAGNVRARLVALLPVAVAAGVAVPVLSHVDSPAVANPDARALVCAGDLCVTRAHSDYLTTLAAPAGNALDLLKKLPEPPTSVVELVPDKDFRLPPGNVAPVLIEPNWYGMPAVSERTGEKDASRLIVANAVAPACDELVREDDAIARAVAVGWVTGELGPIPGESYLWDTSRDRITQVWRDFRALPAAEQRDRVTAVRAAARDCRTGLLSIVEGS